MSLTKRVSAVVFALPILVAFLAAVAVADEMAMPSGVKGEMLMWIKDAEGKLVQLADATPQGKYSWRPGKDVRTTGEVFMHVATANYGMPGFLGVTPPAGFNFETFEKSQTKKDEIVKTLKDSFAHMENAFMALSDADLDKPVDIQMIGLKTTVRGAYMLLLSHAHEHLGQSIAYARSNGIVPPWTAKQQQAMKEMQEKKKAAGN